MEMQESISAAELERKLGPLDRETYTAASCERSPFPVVRT